MYKENLALKFEIADLIEAIDQMYDGFLISSIEGRIIYANQAVARIVGESLDNIIGKTPNEMEKDGLIVKQSIVVESDKPITMIHEVRQGKTIFVTSTPIYKDEQLICFIANYRELSALKQLHEQHINTIKKRKRIPTVAIKNESTWIGVSEATKQLKNKVAKIAKTEATVLIQGESGVGKEIVANQIHQQSNRQSTPYIPINCGAIPQELFEAELFGYEKGAFTGATQTKIGLLEAANRGTVLLDEIGELPLTIQVKLLRALQTQTITRVGGTKERKLNIRFIAATNQDLKSAVEKGTFRKDLYYRLNVIPLTVLPLRSRKDDIVPLALYFLDKFNAKYHSNKSFSAETLQIIQDYSWPGNVRQLENMIERLIIISETQFISPYDLPQEFKIKNNENFEEIKPLNVAKAEAEIRMIQLALHKYGSIRQAAKYLKVDHSTIVRKIKKYKINTGV